MAYMNGLSPSLLPCGVPIIATAIKLIEEARLWVVSVLVVAITAKLEIEHSWYVSPTRLRVDEDSLLKHMDDAARSY